MPMAVQADQLVVCGACGAGFGEPCTPRVRLGPARKVAYSSEAAPPSPGQVSCIARRLRRHLTFRGLGDDVVGELLRRAGPGGSREEVISVLRERAEARR